MYAPEPTAEELEVAGLRPEDVATSIEIWPDNLRAYELFNALGTQWRIGMAGATGLDYGAIEVALRLQRVPRAEWPQLFEDIRTMEGAALAAMRPDE